MPQVYFDNAATTPVRETVIEAITETMKNQYGNASSTHAFGRSAKVLIEKSRKTIAQYLNVSAGEIIFTSGGTEADNFILNSAVADLKVKRIITTKIEHHAVLHTVEHLEKTYGITVNYVEINTDGTLNLEHFEGLLKQSTDKTLVSLMHINNEIGTILNLKRVSSLCKAHNALFHTDAVQSVGHYQLDLQYIQVDFLAASAHKFHGPKGVGFAFIRKNSGLQPLLFGGEQERGLRAGTEGIHNIIGMEVALKAAYDNLETEQAYILSLKQYFVEKLKAEIPKVSFNGFSDTSKNNTYTLVNISLPVSPKKGAMLLFQLDLKGIACSKGSACQSGSSQNSHVLTEILSEAELLKPSLRFSFSIYNTKEEVDYAVDVLKQLTGDG
ncbi:MAG: cysteine desulfurase family protein [Flavobacteriaceae bacterium]